MTNRIGETFGNYRLLSILGSGGFADVYLGENIHLGTKVAIKIIGKNGLSPAETEGFIKEAKTISLLNHPNIVKVLDFGIRDNIPYLVMDYMPGSLRQKHPKGVKLLEQVVVSYVKQLAGALQHAHDNGIIHRDVKPENVLLRNKTQELCLTDFGIAVQAQRTQSQTEKDIIGTLPYMSPEHFLGKVKKASDQYSLGIMTYEWFCGTRPFEGDSLSLPYLHIHHAPPSFRERDTVVHPVIEAIVMRALAKRPEERFETIQQFADALEQAITHTASGHMTPLAGGPQPTIYTIPPTQLAVPVITENRSTTPAGTPVTRPMQDAGREFTEQVTSTGIAKQHPVLSRRNMLIGIGAVFVTGAGITWWVKNSSGAQETPSRQGTSTQSTHVGKQELSFNIPSANCMVLSPDGTKFAVGTTSQGKLVLQIRDLKTAKVIASSSGHTIIIQSVAWSPDGTKIASCGDQEHSIHIWDVINNKTTLFTDPDSASVVAWSPDSKKLVSAGGSQMKVWDARTGQVLTTYNPNVAGGISALAWAPNGRLIASAGENVQLWYPDGQTLLTYGNHTSIVYTVAWSPNSFYLASGGKDLTAQVWPASNTGSVVQIYKGHLSWVDSVAWYPLTDKNIIVSGDANGIVQVWDAASGHKFLQYQGSEQAILYVSWTPDGTQVVSLGADGNIYVRNVPM